MDTMNLMMEAFKAIDESRHSATAIVNPSAESAGPAPQAAPDIPDNSETVEKPVYADLYNQRRVDSFG